MLVRNGVHSTDVKDDEILGKVHPKLEILSTITHCIVLRTQMKIFFNDRFLWWMDKIEACIHK